MFSRIGKFIDKQIEDMDKRFDNMIVDGKQTSYLKTQQFVSQTVNGETKAKEVMIENINGKKTGKTRTYHKKGDEKPIVKEEPIKFDQLTDKHNQLTGQLTDKHIQPKVIKYKVNKY